MKRRRLSIRSTTLVATNQVLVFLFLGCMFSPIPVAVRSKAQVCDCSITGIAGLNPTGGMDVFVSFVCVV